MVTPSGQEATSLRDTSLLGTSSESRSSESASSSFASRPSSSGGRRTRAAVGRASWGGCCSETKIRTRTRDASERRSVRGVWQSRVAVVVVPRGRILLARTRASSSSRRQAYVRSLRSKKGDVRTRDVAPCHVLRRFDTELKVSPTRAEAAARRGVVVVVPRTTPEEIVLLLPRTRAPRHGRVAVLVTAPTSRLLMRAPVGSSSISSAASASSSSLREGEMRGGEMRGGGEMMAGGVAHEESGPTPLPALLRRERARGEEQGVGRARHMHHTLEAPRRPRQRVALGRRTRRRRRVARVARAWRVDGLVTSCGGSRGREEG